MITERKDLRNIAIIAHVDHGKTTLVDGMLRQAQVFRANQKVAERVLDSNDLERERGITILSKNTSITVTDTSNGDRVKINIVDTPGHADFGGEVERVLNMVDAVLLLVDAFEGPRPQTRFVLRKALEMGLKAIVVINKVDRRNADPERVLNDTFDLFIELGATDEQTDFPVVYTVATTGQAGETPEVSDNLQPLFDIIIKEVACPKVDLDAPLQILVTAIDYDKYRGVTGVGRIHAGRILNGQKVARIDREGKIFAEEVPYLYVHDGLQRLEVDSAEAGEIIAISGLKAVNIGETLADPNTPVALPTISIEEPTVRMTFGVNTSPFAGTEGRWGTSRKLRERLYEELKQNVALKVEDTDSAENFVVAGRGELHLAILIETMRREGYEFQVSRPEVILKKGEDGITREPFEEAQVETPPDTVGAVIEMLGKRRGELVEMGESTGSTVSMTYIIPTRGLLGFRYQFLTATRGMGVINTLFHGFQPMAGSIQSRLRGSLTAREQGSTTTYGLRNAEPRGILFCGPGVKVYESMVIGEHQRPGDLSVNVVKKKHLDNMRSANRDVDGRLAPPRDLSLDEAIEYLDDDELLEVTPESLRIRKRILNTTQRERHAKRAKAMMEAVG